MLKMSKIVVLSILFSTGINLTKTSSSLAGIAGNGGRYARQAVVRTTPILTGRFFRNVLGQEDLILFQRTPLDTVSKQQSINKTMWLIGPTNEWVETGAVNGWTSANGGLVNTTFWKGSYYAKQVGIFYTRMYLGSSGVTGQLSYQLDRVQSGSTFNWTAKVTSASGTTISSPPISHTKGAFSQMQVGIETKNACNGFKSNTYSDALYFRDTAFKLWSTGSVINGDLNNNVATDLSIRNSIYSPTTNRVTFSFIKTGTCT